MALAPGGLCLRFRPERSSLVDLGLRFGIHAANGVVDLAVDRIDCLADPFPAVALFVAVAQFDRLVCAG
jgi:hypothetical protein